MRIDKYLWCVRLCKTRTVATEVCAAGKITMDEKPVKPSREIGPGEVFKMRQTPIWRLFEIVDIPKSRVGAKLVTQYLRETTDSLEMEQLEEVRRLNAENRAAGTTGRPTKKDRRNLNRFKDI